MFVRHVTDAVSRSFSFQKSPELALSVLSIISPWFASLAVAGRDANRFTDPRLEVLRQAFAHFPSSTPTNFRCSMWLGTIDRSGLMPTMRRLIVTERISFAGWCALVRIRVALVMGRKQAGKVLPRRNSDARFF